MAGFEVEGQGVGYTEGEKLLDKRNWLAKQQQGFGATKDMDADKSIRAGIIMNSLRETEFNIQRRILNIDKERRQIMIETQREFQKSLITAGPGDILRKLATASLMKGGKVGAGQFFSMSGEMRGDAYNLMGGEGAAKLNWEEKSLRGQKLSVEGARSVTQAGEDYSHELGVRLKDIFHNGVLTAAAEAASHMSAAAVSAGAIETAMANAAKAIAFGAFGKVAANSTPNAGPVPQSVPNSHGATVTDYSQGGVPAGYKAAWSSSNGGAWVPVWSNQEHPEMTIPRN